MSEYRKSPLRHALQLLHSACRGLGQGLELASDAVAWIGLGIAVCLGVAWVFSSWFPLTETSSDFWLWIAIWFVATTVIALSLRSLRRRRFGDLPSRHIKSIKDGCSYVLAGWLGILASVAFWHSIASAEPLGAWGFTMALLAVGTLLPTFLGLYKYVRERGERLEWK